MDKGRKQVMLRKTGADIDYVLRVVAHPKNALSKAGTADDAPGDVAYDQRFGDGGHMEIISQTIRDFCQPPKL